MSREKQPCVFCKVPTNKYTYDHHPLCDECLVKHRDELFIFHPTTCIPNFYTREHFAYAIPEVIEAPDEKVMKLSRMVEDELCDGFDDIFFEEIEKPKYRELFLSEDLGKSQNVGG